MTNLWDDIAKSIREGVDTVVEKTGELTKMGKIKVDIINIKRNVEKNFAELGGKVYHLIVEEKSTQVAANKEVKELIECIKILEKELQEKNEEMKNVKPKNESAGESKPEVKKTTSSAKKKTAPKKKDAPPK